MPTVNPTRKVRMHVQRGVGCGLGLEAGIVRVWWQYLKLCDTSWNMCLSLIKIHGYFTTLSCTLREISSSKYTCIMSGDLQLYEGWGGLCFSAIICWYRLNTQRPTSSSNGVRQFRYSARERLWRAFAWFRCTTYQGSRFHTNLSPNNLCDRLNTILFDNTLHNLHVFSHLSNQQRVIIISRWAVADDLRMLGHRWACADRQVLLNY